MTLILIVDDDEAIRQMLRDMLEREGFDVLDAANGKEALTLFHITHPDLVITNIVMPEKEGLELIRELRKESPDTRIIAISGGGQYGYVDYLEVARTFGAMRTLAKPFARAQLLEAVSAVLGTPRPS
jgi:YesN/AraC family two-component response regulator